MNLKFLEKIVNHIAYDINLLNDVLEEYKEFEGLSLPINNLLFRNRVMLKEIEDMNLLIKDVDGEDGKA